MAASTSEVTITRGDAAHSRGEWWHVLRKDLLAHVQVLLERGAEDRTEVEGG
jgi:hypothetical protein